MMKFNEGDHVRVTPKSGGNVVIEGKVSNLRDQEASRIVDVKIDGDQKHYGGRPFSLEYWNVELLDPAKVLPTEPGRYLDNDNEAWELTSDGRWLYGGDVDDDTVKPAEYLPFERIYTLSEAAEIVATYLEERCFDGAPKTGYAQSIRNAFRDA